jgi:hypothetical protein
MAGNADGHVYELRIHGVSGTPPESMLSDPFPEQVWGDDVARFFQKTDPIVVGGKSRIVEAFHWGRFTSGSATRTLWLLLLPFALLNLSRYMLLSKRKRPDAFLRLLGLVLTTWLVANVVYVSLELIMRQCASRAQCLKDNAWLNFMDDWAYRWQLLLGMAPVLLVILLLWWFGRQTFLYSPRGETREWNPEHGSMRDTAFWHTSLKAPVLRALHVAAACATAGVMHAGVLNTDVAGKKLEQWSWQWWLGVGFGVALLVLVIATVCRPPSATLGQNRRSRDPLKVPSWIVWLKWISLGYLVLASAATVWYVPEKAIDVPLAGFEVVAVVQSAFAVMLLIALAMSCRGPKSDRPVAGHRAFKPMWFGFGTLFIAMFALLLGAGFSGGLAYRIADLLGDPIGPLPLLEDGKTRQIPGPSEFELSTTYWTGTQLWGLLAVVFLVLLLPLLAAATTRRYVAAALLLLGEGCAAFAFGFDVFTAWWYVLTGAAAALFGGGVAWCLLFLRGEQLDRLVRKDYLGEKDDGVEVTEAGDPPQPRAIGKVVTAWRLARIKYRYHWALGTICLLGGGLVTTAGAFALLRTVNRNTGIDPFRGLVDVGGWVLTGLATGLVAVGIRSWQGQKMRTVVGVVWDLISFWPRYAHPICPPPYGGRATLTLYERAKYLVSREGRGNTVVLSGHSQGAVMCVAAALLLDRDPEAPNDQLRLITYGSQLQWAFARLFPRYLGYEELACVDREFSGRWWNVHRWTDPLGGHVVVWPDSGETNHPVSAQDWRGFRGLRYQNITETRWYERLGNEIRLRDPESIASRNDRPRSPLRGHSGYYLDPSFDALVADLAATRPDEPPPEPPVPPALPDPGLNAAELALVRNSIDGAELDCRDLAPPHAEDLGRRIRATVISSLLRGEFGELHARGVQLRKARIVSADEEPLNIDGLDVRVGLRLDDCRLDCAIRAHGARVKWLELVNCDLPGLFANRIAVAYSVTLQGLRITGNSEQSLVQLSGAAITHDLDLDGAQLCNEGSGPAVVARDIEVGGTVRFRNGTVTAHCTSGAIQLGRARLGGDLWLDGTKLHNEDGAALDGEKLRAKGSLRLSAGFEALAKGTQLAAVHLPHAVINKCLDLEQARITSVLENPGTHHLTLDLTSADVAELRMPAHIECTSDTDSRDRSDRFALDGLKCGSLPGTSLRSHWPHWSAKHVRPPHDGSSKDLKALVERGRLRRVTTTWWRAIKVARAG